MNPLLGLDRETLDFAVYYAPRGRPRLMLLGETISRRYLHGTDLLIGIVGDSGIGKSSVVSGMFPGLELSNDDAGVNVHPCPLLRDWRDANFRVKTYHMDARFESGFTQPWELAAAMRAALKEGRRIVTEHFDSVYPLLRINAQMLVGIGEDLVVTRPNVFGPHPGDIYRFIKDTGHYRRMAHTAEDLTALVLSRLYGYTQALWHSDVPRGFVIEFDEKPAIDLKRIESETQKLIDAGLDVAYEDRNHLRIGDEVMPCSGPRMHVRNTGEILNYRIYKELLRDELSRRFLLVGQVALPKSDLFIQRTPGPIEDSLPQEIIHEPVIANKYGLDRTGDAPHEAPPGNGGPGGV